MSGILNVFSPEAREKRWEGRLGLGSHLHNLGSHLLQTPVKCVFFHGLNIKLSFSISHLGCNLNRQELHHPHNRIRGQGFGQGMVGLGRPGTRVMTMDQM